MKQLIKQIIKASTPQKIKWSYQAYGRVLHRNRFDTKFKSKPTKLLNFLSFCLHHDVIGCTDNSFIAIAKNQSLIINKIKTDVNHYFIYPLDKKIIRVPNGANVASLTADYEQVLNLSLEKVKQELTDGSDFSQGMLVLIQSIEKLASRIKNKLLKLNRNNPRTTKLCNYFPKMLYRKPESFDEALQKILFYNALLWQNRLWHNGLGRLDKILYPYYLKDIDNGILTHQEAKEKLKHFILTIGKDTDYKSMSLTGDTGQVILLGGINNTGKDVCNPLTLLFIELISELSIPDPKLILRVNSQTPQAIWLATEKCLTTGCGSPLIMNEDVIIPLMEKFGYDRTDCSEVGTSACWEPLIIGKSFDQNNPVANIISLSPLNEILKINRNYETFDEFLNAYIDKLKQNIEKETDIRIQFDKSPILSLLYDKCIENQRDISEGGATYYYHGMQVVSFPNTINSLLNIKKYVFEEKVLTLKQCQSIIENNYQNSEDIRQLFNANDDKFGKATPFILEMTNHIMSAISESISKVRINGNKVKIGFSSPAYIDAARTFPASLDGRKYGEPFATHISPVSQDVDISEILEFATQMDYTGNKLNGNVVDFTIPSAFVHTPEKLISLLKASCKAGVYELQLNVLNAQQLKEAKLHPEKYPNLVVRVWGFSAYFNDLPEEFKDNLIHRAEVYGC